MAETDAGEPDYHSKSVAASSIAAVYRECFGTDLKGEAIEVSLLEKELGRIPDTKYAGIVRILDESIYFSHILYFHLAPSATLGHADKASLFFCFAMRETAAAIRTLLINGFDGAARQNLRCLYEIGLALCRSFVDSDFCETVRDVKDVESSNKTWYKAVRSDKMIKYLRGYNESYDFPCWLVMDDSLEEQMSVLGTSVHPSMIGWGFAQAAYWNERSGEAMIGIDPNRMTQLVPAHASFVILWTLAFCFRHASKSDGLGTFLSKNPGFGDIRSDSELMDKLAKSAGLLALMLAKLTNRQRTDFNKEYHF